MADNLLSIMTFFPLVGMIALLFLPQDNDAMLKSFALAVSLITFLISL